MINFNIFFSNFKKHLLFIHVNNTFVPGSKKLKIVIIKMLLQSNDN